MSREKIYEWATKIPDDNGGEHALGIDRSGHLCWDGERVVTEHRLSLGWWVNVSIVLGALSTIVLAVCAVLEFFWG